MYVSPLMVNLPYCVENYWCVRWLGWDASSERGGWRKRSAHSCELSVLAFHTFGESQLKGEKGTKGGRLLYWRVKINLRLKEDYFIRQARKSYNQRIFAICSTQVKQNKNNAVYIQLAGGDGLEVKKGFAIKRSLV